MHPLMAENVGTRGAVGAGGCRQSNGSEEDEEEEEEEEEEERYRRIVVALLHQHDFCTTQYLEPGLMNALL